MRGKWLWYVLQNYYLIVGLPQYKRNTNFHGCLGPKIHRIQMSRGSLYVLGYSRGLTWVVNHLEALSSHLSMMSKTFSLYGVVDIVEHVKVSKFFGALRNLVIVCTRVF